jgi:hypothetical protein
MIDLATAGACVARAIILANGALAIGAEGEQTSARREVINLGTFLIGAAFLALHLIPDTAGFRPFEAQDIRELAGQVDADFASWTQRGITNALTQDA